MKRSDIVIATSVLALGVGGVAWLMPARVAASAAEEAKASIVIDYPLNGSIFPPEITPPTFLWHDRSADAQRWRIEFRFADRKDPMTFETSGPPQQIGEIDPRCISSTNELPRLTEDQMRGHSWSPDSRAWQAMKKRSVTAPVEVRITGLDKDGSSEVSHGAVRIMTSSDPVGAPIFYRDVPLMPSETEKGVIKPLDPKAVNLIQWRLRSIGKTQSTVVLEGMHTCANCHSFSRDGKTMGIDMDGPQNDKGLYAVVPIHPQTTITSREMVSWNPTQDRQFKFNRVGFMSQVSPDGRFVLTMLTSTNRPPGNNYYVANFKDYKFLQVFYPTRGILYWYDRATGQRHPLPGADDPAYVQTNGVWSPDGKYVVFARARAVEPYRPDGKMAAYPNDPNEIQIQYDLYRVPFNGGRGGVAEPIIGASENGMSNSFPKISPDGRWIVFVEAKNGEVMRPDGKLYIVPAQGGTARCLTANMSPMNSWHSWSPNGRWLVFSSKARGPYTKMFLTHIDEEGNDSPAILIENSTAANRAVNLPEFVNIAGDGLLKILTPAVDMYTKFDHAAELARAGDYRTAMTEWKALARSNPDDARIHNNYGNALMHLGSYQEAVNEFREALRLNPQYHLVHGNLASALMSTGRATEALQEFELGLEADPDSPELHNAFGAALRVEKQDELARREFERAIELKPEFAEAHNNLGLLMLEYGQGQAELAEREFQEAIRINPGFADAQNNLGTLYAEEGKGAEAEELLRAAVKNDPAMTKAKSNLAAVLADESRFTEAEVLLEEAVKADPEDKTVRALMDMIREQQKH